MPTASSSEVKLAAGQPRDDDANARHGDVETLRRLTREAFGEITSLRDRLRDLEKSVATERASRAAESVRVNTRVDLGTTLMGSFGNALRAVNKGVDALTTVEAPFPRGDSLVLRCATKDVVMKTNHHRNNHHPSSSASAATTPTPVVVLDKLMYRCRVGTNGWLRVAPIGGEGQDAAATLNPLSRGASLTGMGASGSSLLAGCHGPALCG